MDLKNKVVLVTGSSSGIGRETAIKFSRKGCRVVLTYNLEKERGVEVLAECKKNSDAILVHLDVKDDASIEKLHGDVMRKYGRIDVLVNNAGVIVWRSLAEQKTQEIDEQIKVNLLGAIKVTCAFIHDFYRQKNGLILNVASGAGKEGARDLTVYCASKFGVRGFTQALAQELPEGVRTYCINPGMTATRMTGYQGAAPSDVAGIIVAAAEEKLKKKSGDDVDVWEYLDQ